MDKETAQFILSLMAKSKSSLWGDIKKLVRNRLKLREDKILGSPLLPGPSIQELLNLFLEY
jgi:hypothetical protein